MTDALNHNIKIMAKDKLMIVQKSEFKGTKISKGLFASKCNYN